MRIFDPYNLSLFNNEREEKRFWRSIKTIKRKDRLNFLREQKKIKYGAKLLKYLFSVEDE